MEVAHKITKVFNLNHELGWFAKTEEGRVLHTFEAPELNEWHTTDAVDADSFVLGEIGDKAYAAYLALVEFFEVQQ